MEHQKWKPESPSPLERTAATDEAIQAIDQLTRSRTRVRLLGFVRRHGPVHRDDLRDRFDVNRTTLQRNLQVLEERNWIRREGTQYSLTPCGRLVTDELVELVETTRVAQRLKDALKWVPVDELDVDLHHLADADVTLSKPSNPYAPVDRHVETLETVADVRVLLSAIGKRAIDVTVSRIEAEEGDWTLVITPDIVRTLESSLEYRDKFEAMVESDRVTVLVFDGQIPFYLGILDETVQIGVEDENGIPRALVETDAAPVRTWAEREYAKYSDRARRLGAT